MGASPSVRYHIDLTNNEAWARNELFPEQRIEIDKQLIQDLKGIMALDVHDELEKMLRDKYREAYLNS